MKSKFSRILGVGLTIAVLASMLVVGSPVSAGTLTPTNEFSPPTMAGADIVDIAAAGNGTTIYAASDNVDLLGPPGNGMQLLVKSANSGTSWSSAGTPQSTATPPAFIGNLPSNIARVTDIALAPDAADGSWLAIIAADNASGQMVLFSQDGAATFTSLATPAAGANLRDIAVAGTVGTVTKTLVVVGDLGGLSKVWMFAFGAPIPGWVDITVDNAATTAVEWGGFDATGPALAVALSPNYASDRTIAVVTSVAGSTKVQYANTSFMVWNGLLFFGDAVNTGVPVLVDVASVASLALAPTFNGLDESARVAYVGITAGTPANSGLYRVRNTAVARLFSGAINSVALNTAGDKLVAGSFNTNNVIRVASPLSALAESGEGATGRKRPSVDLAGNEMMVVAFAGTNVVAAGSGPESAFSISADDGRSFKDVSLVDSAAATTTRVDFGLSADGAKAYVGTYNSAVQVFSLWHRDPTAWERVFVYFTPASAALVRVAPDNGDVVYIAETTGSTNNQIYYTNDGGQTTWNLTLSPAPLTDLAVESVSVLYGLSSNVVRKTENSGGLWDTGVNLTFGGATIMSLGAGNVVVGGAGGRVAYLTGGNWTTLGPPLPVAGNVHVTASGLASGGFIYAAADAAGTSAYRWTIGTSTSWSNMRTSAMAGNAKGIALSGGALYVVTDDGTNTHLYRSITPNTAAADGAWSAASPLLDNSSPGASVAAPFNVRFTDTPRALVATLAQNQPKLWALDMSGSRLESFTDILVAASPAFTAPADRFEVPINDATGAGNNIVFQWAAVAGTSPTTTYRLQIALDTAFTQVVFGGTSGAGSTPIAGTLAIVGPTAAVSNLVFPFQADTTYYWRVRVESPLNSPYQATPRSFKIGSLRPLTLQSPANGAMNASVNPTFVWSPVAGATTYELVVSDDPTFAIITFSRTTSQPVFASDEQLAYDTVYYWRVRASAPATAVTPFATGIFTTGPRPPTPTTAPPPVTITQTSVTVTVPPATTVDVIPSYLLWIIIGIGAILVIALIVLIVRTRRTG